MSCIKIIKGDEIYITEHLKITESNGNICFLIEQNDEFRFINTDVPVFQNYKEIVMDFIKNTNDGFNCKDLSNITKEKEISYLAYLLNNAKTLLFLFFIPVIMVGLIFYFMSNQFNIFNGGIDYNLILLYVILSVLIYFAGIFLKTLVNYLES